MGGHGALISHFKNPGQYTSVSAFAPICNPTAVPWGEKAFKVGSASTSIVGSVIIEFLPDHLKVVGWFVGSS